MSYNFNLSLSLRCDSDNITQVVGTSVNLDTIVEEFLKGSEVENLVIDGLLSVDDELLCDLWALLSTLFLYHHVISL
jgi:hypothetical protein